MKKIIMTIHIILFLLALTIMILRSNGSDYNIYKIDALLKFDYRFTTSVIFALCSAVFVIIDTIQSCISIVIYIKSLSGKDITLKALNNLLYWGISEIIAISSLFMYFKYYLMLQ